MTNDGPMFELVECMCDTCGKTAVGRNFMDIAIAPPAGWFVRGKVVLDEVVGEVEQWFYCSETCCTQIDGAARMLAESAGQDDEP
jgi:hypothetical protein